MTLRTRLSRLEAARGTRPDPDAGAAFAALAATLDGLAARKAAGDGAAQRDIGTLAAMLGANVPGDARLKPTKSSR